MTYPKYIPPPEDETQKEIFYKCLGFMDSEFDNLKGITRSDLGEYLSGIFPDIARGTVDKLFHYFTDKETL